MKFVIAILLLAATASAQTADKLEGGALFSGTFLRQVGSSDSGIGTSAIGIGGRVVYHAFPHIDFESELILWPNNPATSGTWVQGFFGAKAGKRFDKFGIFAKARPGFMHFAKDPFNPRPASRTEPAVDLGGVLEYYTSRSLILRFDLGDTMIRYGDHGGSQPGFTTQNWQGSLGFDFRF